LTGDRQESALLKWPWLRRMDIVSTRACSGGIMLTAICIVLLPVQTGHYNRRSLVVAV
jgi:hypothetical protein